MNHGHYFYGSVFLFHFMGCCHQSFNKKFEIFLCFLKLVLKVVYIEINISYETFINNILKQGNFVFKILDSPKTHRYSIFRARVMDMFSNWSRLEQLLVTIFGNNLPGDLCSELHNMQPSVQR